MRRVRRRCSVIAVQSLVCLAAVLGAQTQPAVAQAPATRTGASALELDGNMTPQQRDALYASLAKEVADYERHHNIIKTAARLVSPTVVHIEAEIRDSGGRPYGRRTVQEAGSGVLVEISGAPYVLTNRHVIRDAKLNDIQIRFSDGRMTHPTKSWGDPDTDVGVLAVHGPDYVTARIGNSDALEVGDMVLAVGSPFGLSHSITYGIISAKGRRDLELGDGGVRFQDFIQTDASINPGNSGGPLINLRGEVVGINTAIASNSGFNEGIGFSIPINIVVNIARQLIEHGVVTRAYLGVRLDSRFNAQQALEAGLPRLTGARLLRIEPGSPAEAAGLQAGDVIVQFNGQRVDNDNHLINIVGLTPVGTEVSIIIYRDRQPMTIRAKIGNANETAPAQTPAQR
ncbi:MAG TPA: trypsin-like peptidase domain-containing protein [Pirellulales bacterium]|nr:trypsin-like peptidase domain-containing protein [Pirellulales bacterium]